MTERYRQQAEAFINETMAAEIPSIATDAGSGANNIIARVGGAVGAGLHQEIEHTLTSRDISDPEAISTVDMDRNLEPLLVERDEGEVSKGFVNYHFPDRRARTITQGTRATNADKDLGFLVESDLSFVESDYLVEPSDGSFYLRVPFAAEEAGPEYDVDVGEINTPIGDRLGVLYIRNTSAFFGGQPAQTNTEFVQTARRSVGTRNQINIDGNILTLQRLFQGKLLDALIIGNGDPEMLRDELYDNGGTLMLGPDGTPSGIHIGGRTDAYHWYRNVNYVEVTVDLTIDLITASGVSIGADTVEAKFSPGTTTNNTVPESGAIVMELGGAAEETLRYDSVAFDSLTGIYTFTLATGVTAASNHAAGSGVKIAGTGAITVALDGAISTLPVLLVKSVRLLDPLTLAPIGDPLEEVTPESRSPGWYIEDVNKLNHMSAKETKIIRVNEKRDVDGNQPLSNTDGVTAATRLLSSATTDFTGYQGRDITITAGIVTVTRTILRVISATQIEYSDGDEVLADGSGRTFSVEAGYGDYLQYPVRVSFYTHTEIQEAQAVFDGGRARIVCSDILSRVFLPVFLDFTLRYKGSMSEDDVRKRLLELIQDSQGSSLGTNQGARFDVSDIIAALYKDNQVDSVEVPMEIKITRVNVDGTKTIKWVAPTRETVNDLAISVAASPGDTTVTATRPVQVPSSSIPDQGKLFLGAYVGNQETLTYDRVVFDGSDMIFILTEGQEVGQSHGLNEMLRVSVSDFDPDNVITDGVISEDREYRPYFGNAVVVEQI